MADRKPRVQLKLKVNGYERLTEMKEFLDNNFLLETKTAQRLFHDYADKMPIIDYHCHVSPREIAMDIKLGNIAEAWLGDDHYKWRMIRACGVPEKYITGDASPREKFQKFAEALPYAIGNPLYHWTHLELRRYFDCDLEINAKNAEKIWELCNARLSGDDMSVRNIIRKSNVTHICTTDDPVDNLEWHKSMSDDKSWEVKVLPAFRPDKAISVESPDFSGYISTLSRESGIDVKSIDNLHSALKNRMDYFSTLGCVTSDHGLDYIPWVEGCEDKADAILLNALTGSKLKKADVDAFKSAMMVFLAKEYARRGWVMQIHFNVARSVNAVMLNSAGPNTGFDSISGKDNSYALYKLLDTINSAGGLPKTVLYSLNPNDDTFLATAAGSFQAPGIPGKIQHGSAWWHNDTKTGMQQQLTTLANLGVLGNFIGMLTDGRSFLSYTRHEYFRRILCNLIGGWVENGEYPDDIEFLGKLVQDISYNNVKRYMSFTD